MECEFLTKVVARYWHLPLFLLDYRFAIYESTKYTPVNALFGRELSATDLHI